MSEYHVYAVGPQDSGWESFVVADQDWLESGLPDDREHQLAQIEAKGLLWKRAEAAAARHPLWVDGTFPGGEELWPRVSALPSGKPEPLLFFTWMLDSHGTTVVVSPVALPWLDALGGLRLLITPFRDGDTDDDEN